jgi:methyl-accepting chemotaxis protein
MTADAHPEDDVIWLVAAVSVGAALAVVFCALAFARTRSRSDAVFLESVRRLADGDLLTAIAVPRSGAGRELATLLQDLAGRLSLTLTQIEVAKARLEAGWRDIDKMAWQSLDGTETTAARASSAARSADGISANLHMIAAATEELAATIQAVANHASEASTVASTATAEVGAANSTVSELATASRHIEEVLHFIGTIATQTHMLSLNATIEAARAGAAGAGFAVVADEVKALSQQTGAATDNVSASVVSVQSGAVQAAEAMDRVTATISRVNDNQQGIASAVEQQTATTRDIGRNASDAANGATDLAGDVAALVANIRLTAYTGAHARSVAAQLAELEAELGFLVAGYQFDRVAVEAAATVAARTATTVGTVTTIHHDVVGSGLGQIEYTENWRHSTANLESARSDAYCGMPGDTATIRFVGTKIRYFGGPESNRGMIALSVDGGPESVVDQYGTTRDRTLFWESPTLPRAEHTLVVRVTGDQNPLSRYIWVTLECVEIDA